MALSRRMLKAMGIEDEKIDEIVAAHRETVDALIKERDDAKAKAEDADELQRQLAKAQSDLEAASKDDWQAKYEQEHRDFEAFKAEEAKKANDAEKAKAYREQVLGAAKIDPKRMDAIMRLVDIDGFELDEKGQIKGAKELAEGAAKEWAEFVASTGTKGADVPEPPSQQTGATGANPETVARLKARHERLYGVDATQEQVKE